eukprot:TRINITY_DN1465_c0_g1_i4.p1 TRINITY_DN1465_c0_g1~~TRINITY_DN1465_c0_g1_i4.p1  ORF type:complete len:674 (-),score=241.61 TRINITY_DN1465_c0_g1_i4:166-2187(-)
MKSFIFVAFFVLLGSVSSSNLGKELRKQLAGPPSEFGEHDLPVPSSQVQKENSAFFQSRLKVSKNKRDSLYSDFQLNVDSVSNFTFAVVSKHVELLQLSLLDPSGKKVDISQIGIKDEFPIGEFRVPTLVYQFENPTIGSWELKVSIQKASVESSLFDSIAAESDPNVAVILYNVQGVEIFTHLSSYYTHIGNEIGLIATTIDKDLNGRSGNRLGSNSLTAVMDVTLPDGKNLQVMMNDEGRGLDRTAGDGIFAGSVSASENGSYKLKAEIRGANTQGNEFVRTSQHLVNVVQQSLQLNGKAFSQVDSNDKQRMQVQLGVTLLGEPKTEKLYRAYAEVYGTDSNGNQVPVCWIGGMTSVESVNGVSVVPLSLDMNWAAMAKAQAPFVLKNVYVSDPISQVPEDSSTYISLEVSEVLHSHFVSLSLSPSSITKEMRQGKLPMKLKARVGGKTGLILVHGYCSGGNPWTSTSDIWTNAHYFLNAKASITNEEFAQKVVSYAESEGLDAYAIVGHSQGGSVAAHILNYYFTGMDNLDSSKRLVQSVGTPYGGSGAAGTAASIGNVVGIGCGSNFDLSHDGAALWQSGITSSARSAVHYYTTTYKSGSWFGDWCSLPMNLILQWPNDGTTELDYAHLKGAVFEGNTEKQCHVTDMRYPVQTADRNRNAILNAKAASN